MQLTGNRGDIVPHFLLLISTVSSVVFATVEYSRDWKSVLIGKREGFERTKKQRSVGLENL